MTATPVIAYFSMEIGVETGMPTYAGGLGVLAGDTVRAAADLQVPLVAVTLLHRKGYFHQTLDSSGWQKEDSVEWVVADFLEEMPQRVWVTIEGRIVQLRAWKYEVVGVGGHKAPVFFLDVDLPTNTDSDRTLTDFLYGGDQRYRLCQEVILGMGGVRMLQALGYEQIARYHMNEGHAGLLTVELLMEEATRAGRSAITHDDVEAVRRRCVFTTHTPVPSGHDQFPLELVDRVLGRPSIQVDWKSVVLCEGRLNMTFLALSLSHYVNGVAKKHGEVSRLMFAHYTIDSITNGIHAATWASEPIAQLFDRHIPDWKHDYFSLRYAHSIHRHEVWDAHQQAKQQLIRYVNRETNAGMNADALTLGFARRFATYKRPDLLFQDVQRLRRLATPATPLQVIFAGKAHPRDNEGKELIRQVIQTMASLRPEIRAVYLPNYDMDMAKLLTAGVDVWLNTPQPPLEASGTSGMKAALNGVPSLSVLDGWWTEGCIEGVTGWAIGKDARNSAEPGDRADDAQSLYEKLEGIIIPMFYDEPERFMDIMRHCIGLNASFFNTHRMMQQYVLNAYFR
jgi:starch phosphorylase